MDALRRHSQWTYALTTQQMRSGVHAELVPIIKLNPPFNRQSGVSIWNGMYRVANWLSE